MTRKGWKEAKKLLPGKVQSISMMFTKRSGADAVVLMTEWNEYRGLDPERIRELMTGNIFVDLRNVYERACNERTMALNIPVLG